MRFDGVTSSDPSAPSATPGVMKAWTDAAVLPLIVVVVANARVAVTRYKARADPMRPEPRAGAVVIQPEGSSTRPPYDGAANWAASGSPETAA